MPVEPEPKKRRKLWILPADISFSFSGLRNRVSGLGMNFLAQRVLAGFWMGEMKKVRIDQLHTALQSGVFIADLIDEDNMPGHWERIIKFLGRFINLDSLSDRIPDLITPEFIMNVIRESNPEAFGLIINSDAGGIKWFYNQADYGAAKLQEVIRRVASG